MTAPRALTWDDAFAVERRLVALTGAEVVQPNDPRRALLLDVLGEVWRAAGVGWDRAAAAERVSFCLPALGPLVGALAALPFAPRLLELAGEAAEASFGHPTVILAPAALASPLVYAETGVHEFNHALQPPAAADVLPGVPAGDPVAATAAWCVAYALRPEVRALAAEGPCYVAEIALGHWYAGADPDAAADAVVARLAPYGIDGALAGDVRRQLGSHVRTLRRGLCPAHATLIEAVRALRARGHDHLPALPDAA